uniref:COX assembly mitochondrial protein n=12 Tax=Passeriformes TaxID=9126 RepID=A0A674HDJ4_TAEGU
MSPPAVPTQPCPQTPTGAAPSAQRSRPRSRPAREEREERPGRAAPAPQRRGRGRRAQLPPLRGAADGACPRRCSICRLDNMGLKRRNLPGAQFCHGSGCAGVNARNSKLRHVEKDVLIPQIMRDRAKELCSDKVQAFTKCCQETGLLMVVKCRQENTALKDCLVGYYSDPSFYEECKAEYLKQREEYRATGIKKKRQKFTPNV